MILRPLAAFILTVSLAAGLAGPGWSQGKPKKAIPAIGLDAGPAEGEGPDPLAPSEGPKKAPTAPGAPTKSAEPKPAAEVHPDRRPGARASGRLRSKGSAGDREDYAALGGLLCRGRRAAGVDQPHAA